jgi:hypothetical protein
MYPLLLLLLMLLLLWLVVELSNLLLDEEQDARVWAVFGRQENPCLQKYPRCWQNNLVVLALQSPQQEQREWSVVVQ